MQGLGAQYVLVGDDFRFGAKRAGDYAMLDAAGVAQGFDVARMNSYEVHGLRVSSSAVREALGEGRMADAAAPAGPALPNLRARGAWPQTGPGAGFRTLNLRFSHWNPAASGIFVVLVHGLATTPCPAWPTWAFVRRWTRVTSTAGACCWKPIAWTGPPAWGQEGVR